MNPEEEKKLQRFRILLSEERPKIGTVIEMIRDLNTYTDYYLSTIKKIQDSKNSLENTFDGIITSSFSPEELGKMKGI